MASQWIPPLPANFEARWDPNQRAYFFINHRDKSTTWQDPRFSQQPNAHQAAAQKVAGQEYILTSGGDRGDNNELPFLNQQGAGARSQGHNIPMQMKHVQFGSTTSTELDADDDESESETDFDMLFASTTGDRGKKVDVQKLHKIRQMYPDAPEDVVKSFLLRNNNVEVLTVNQLFEAGYKYSRDTASPHPAPKVSDMTERLRAMFPTANTDLVNDILSQSNNDEKKARARLEAIGYRPTFPATHKSSSRSTSPARSKETTPKRATSPAKPKLSEAEKNKRVNHVKSKYPLVERSVVEMALQVCNYDESRVKAVLDRMADTSSQSRPSTSTSSSRTTVRSVSPKPFITHSLEPAAFDYSDISRPSSSTREPSPAKAKSSSSKASGSRSQSKSSSPAPRSAKSTTKQQQRAKQVTHGPTQGVIRNQPNGSAYVSPNRTPAKGPDPSLRVGPNKDILLTDYAFAKGSNPELREGPDPNRVHGSQGAVGRDRFLVCGPVIGMQCGPASGSNQEPGRSLIVTAI